MRAISSPRLLAALVTLSVLAGIAVHLATSRYRARAFETEDPEAELRPLDRAAYAARLAREAGEPLRPEAMAEIADATAAAVERRLETLAESISPGAGWRKVFARLASTGPGTSEAILERYAVELERARAFVAERRLVTLPAAPLEVIEVANSGIRDRHPLALYLDRRLGVVTDRTRQCSVCIPPLAVHEGYPGHHTAFERAREAGWTPPEIGSPAEAAGPRFLVEGWALYAELLMLEQGYYAEPERELAAWRMVLLRAVRAAVDARLHGGGLDPLEAEALYRDRLVFDAEAAGAEVRSHLERPAAKASYLGGALQIRALGAEVERRAANAGRMFVPREFHDRLLAAPPAPLPETGRRVFGLEVPPPLVDGRLTLGSAG